MTADYRLLLEVVRGTSDLVYLKVEQKPAQNTASVI